MTRRITSTQGTASKARERMLIFLAAALAAYAIGALLFSYYARSNYDETLFLYASNLVYDGKLPYRDFLFTFGPLMPLVYGLPQALFGPSLLVGRITSAGLSVVTAGAGGYIAYRFAGRLGSLVFLALLALNPLILWIFTVPKTESLVAPLVMVALALWIARPRNPLALAIAASLLLWAVAVRHTAVLAFLGLTGVLFYQLRDRPRYLTLTAGALALQGLALFGILASIAPRNMFFGLLESHWRFRQGNYALGDRLVDMGTYPFELTGDFFAILIPAAVVVTVLAVGWRRGWRPDLRDLDTDATSAQALLVLAAALLFLPHVFLRWTYTHYFVISATVLAIMVGISMRDLAASTRWRTVGFALLAAVIVAQAITFGLRQSTYLISGSPTVDVNRDVTRYVQGVVGEDGQMVTMNPGYALVPSLPLPPELTMGVLSYSASSPSELAEQRHYANREWLDATLADPRTRLVILDDWSALTWVLAGVKKRIPIAETPDDLEAVEIFYLNNVIALFFGGYHLDRDFERQFSDVLPGTHAFIREGPARE